MTNNTSISVFTPSRSNPEDLEAILVQREDILSDAIERVIESANTDNKHHLQFVGQRGTGKTHLMTLLVHRLSQNKSLDSTLRIAWLNEDETSTSLLEFLVRIFLALGKRYPQEFSEEIIDPIYDLAVEDAEPLLVSLLLKHLQNRCLLVVVENLDALFEGLGKKGQRKLRAFIQENPVLSIVATAQRLVDDISKRNSAFFGFFQTEQLKTLDVDQAVELLSKIADRNNQTDLAEFIRTPIGHSRIRALHHLSGGNHRIYIVLSQFITSKTIDGLVEPFTKMIDEMTPYYQERIRWLAPQQRKIVEYLCNCERPATVKQIARRLFSTNQTISSQLKDLRDKGYVQSSQRGRESLYEISEPLMRICVEVKENQSNAPLNILVDFLRVWYDGEELTGLLNGCNAKNMAYPYLKSAISRNRENGNLRSQLLVEGFCKELDHSDPEVRGTLQNITDLHEELGLAYGLWQQGKDNQSLSIFSSITKQSSNHHNLIKLFAWVLSGEIHFKNRQFEQTLINLNEAEKYKDIPVLSLATILSLKAGVYGKIGDHQKEITALSTLINLDGAQEYLIIESLINRAKAYEKLNNIKKATIDYNTIIDSPGTCSKSLGTALMHRGYINLQNSKLIQAEKDFKRSLKLKNVTIEFKLLVHSLLSITYISNDDLDATYTSIDFILGYENEQIGSTEDITLSILDNLFNSAQSKIDHQKNALKLSDIYIKNAKIMLLAESIIKHIGTLLNSEVLADNEALEAWFCLWNENLNNINEMKLPLRIFRTGINFLKSGGKDQTILLDLHKEEREVLKQALGIE